MPPVRPTAGAVEINWSQLLQSKSGGKSALIAIGAVLAAALGMLLLVAFRVTLLN